MAELDSIDDKSRDLEVIACPECGAPAEVLWRTYLSSTDGPIEHIDVLCLRNHSFLMPSEDAA